MRAGRCITKAGYGKGIGGPPIGAVRITAGFWADKIALVARELVPYQWEALNDRIKDAEPSYAVENFRVAAGESGGTFKGTIFQDSDLAKWLEAACYCLSLGRDPRLEAKVDEAVRLIVAAQAPDGYLNTYFLVAAPEKRWTDLAWAHELYCAGHLIEAAVAHYSVTGRKELLSALCRYADLIGQVFGPGEGQIHGFCGHPEIELALYRLYEATNDERYRDLANFFLDERGKDPSYFLDKEAIGFYIPTTKWFRPDYFQSHAPVRDQHTVEGHAVRAMYLYAAMADYYRINGDETLASALFDLWEDMVSGKTYITGGIGSQAHGERFTIPYDLPSGTAYAETCASIGLIFWSYRMLLIDPDSRYADMMERALYNGVLSGVSADGTRYFYVNPLESDPKIAEARHDHEHVKTERVRWFGCACCPPNIARLLASFPSYLYTKSDDTIWVHHYAQGVASLRVGSVGVVVTQTTDYPWDGTIGFVLEPERPYSGGMRLRIPSWCDDFSCAVNGHDIGSRDMVVVKGYLHIEREWTSGDKIRLTMNMRPTFIVANTSVRDLAGMVALLRGPIVYCFEACDNGEYLHTLSVDTSLAIEETVLPGLPTGCVALTVSGIRQGPVGGESNSGRREDLYRRLPEGSALVPDLRPENLVAVPYYFWGNRQPGQAMRVWMRICD